MRRVGAAAALGLAAFAAAAPVAAAAPPVLAQIGTFSEPVYVAAPPNDPRVFVVERRGTVRIVGRRKPFLDITRRVVTGYIEQGLLSIAFPPDYATSGRFDVAFTNRAGDHEVDELRRLVADPNVADPDYRRVLYVIAHPRYRNHNGGNLQFGPDGLLYDGTGDGGGAGDPFGNAQNDTSLLGKLLRIDPRDPNAQPEIFAKGLRNPWRYSFDRQTEDLVIADVGEREVEEIDFAPAPDRGKGANYGWDRFEGDARYAGTEGPAGMVFPVITHTHRAGWCSITGGYVVRDPALSPLAGKYVYGDYCKGDVYAATLPDARDDAPTGLRVASLASFGEDSCGHVYAASLLGPVYLLTSGTATGCPEQPPPASRAPRLRVSAPRSVQTPSSVSFAVACDELCRIAVTARAGRRAAGRLTRTLAPDVRVPLRLALTRVARGTLVLDVVATDLAGRHTSRARVRVRVRVRA